MQLLRTAGLSADRVGGPARGAPGQFQRALRGGAVCRGRRPCSRLRPLRARVCEPPDPPAGAPAGRSQENPGDLAMSQNPASPVIDAASVDAAINSRMSARAFLPDPVPRATIEHLLRLASRSPSGTNTQPWKVYVLQ